jgi:hypothetical protein
MVDQWNDPNLINMDVLKSLTPEQLNKLTEILAKVK